MAILLNLVKSKSLFVALCGGNRKHNAKDQTGVVWHVKWVKACSEVAVHGDVSLRKAKEDMAQDAGQQAESYAMRLLRVGMCRVVSNGES